MHGARLATERDLPVLEALIAVAIAEMQPARGGDLWARTLGRTEPYGPTLVDAIADPARTVVCGTIDGTTVAYGAARLDRLHDGARLAVIEDLFTLPEARHVGVGEAMMDLLISWATEEQAVGIDAVALPGMRDTKNFFESFGLVARALVVHRPLT